MRLPSRAAHLDYLDGWRGLCILLVMAGHFVSPLEPLAALGVELFFVLSGRLMAEILIFKRQPLWLFAKRRFARIVPALAVYVTLAGIAINMMFWSEGLPLNALSPAAALLFVHNYVPHAQVMTGFEHTWSLAVEEHAYFLLILIAFLSRRRPQMAIGLAVAVSALALLNGMLLALDAPTGSQPLAWRSDVRVGSVLLSFALYCAIRQWTVLQKAFDEHQWIAPATLAAALASVWTAGRVGIDNLTLCMVLAALAVNAVGASRPFAGLLRSPLLIWAGTLSFSLYLWQQTFYWLTFVGLSPLLGAVFAIVCALWSFKRVEEPARTYLNARWSGSGTVTAPLSQLGFSKSLTAIHHAKPGAKSHGNGVV